MDHEARSGRQRRRAAGAQGASCLLDKALQSVAGVHQSPALAAHHLAHVWRPGLAGQEGGKCGDTAVSGGSCRGLVAAAE